MWDWYEYNCINDVSVSFQKIRVDVSKYAYLLEYIIGFKLRLVGACNMICK